MLYSYSWLKTYLPFHYTLSPQYISELLTMHAFEVESVQAQGDDWLLDISVLPNRAGDALSHQGMAREINAIAGFKGIFYKNPPLPDLTVTLEQAQQWFKRLPRLENFKIVVENFEHCPLYYALKMTGVRVAASPNWIQESLKTVGQDSINNVVDISNFLLLDMGQPTHIFDSAALGDNTLQVRPARRGESLELLGGANISLSSEDLVIANTRQALAIAGIKGGQHSGVTDQTTDIVIEVANFSPAMIYRSSSSLHITTESAKRFSAGIAYELACLALYRIAQLIQQEAGGSVVGLALCQAQGRPQQHAPIIVDLPKLNKLVGTSIDEQVFHKALFSLGFDIAQESSQAYKVTPPYWRIDCTIPEDISEEVVRLYGLDTIPSQAPRIELSEHIYEDALAWRSFTRQYFVGQGFSEMYNYSLTNNKQLTTDNQQIRILNPISEDKAYLRDNLIDGLLKNVAQNQGFFPELKLFELGKVFWQEDDVVHEREHLAGVLFHKKELQFREARGIAEDFLAACGLDPDDYLLEPTSKGQANPFLSLRIGEQEIGTIQIPSLPVGLKVKGHVAAFELNVQALYGALNNEREFAPPPKFPSVVRDISLLLPKNIKGDSVVQVIHELGKDLIEDVDLFDVYSERSEEKGSDQRSASYEDDNSQSKSLAFHVIYRSLEKTLTDQEVNALHQQIEAELTTRLHAQIR